VDCGLRARLRWVQLWRNAELEESVYWSLNVPSAALRGKTTQPRKWPTAKWDRRTNKAGTSHGSEL